MDQNEINQAEWENPQNWRKGGLGLYYSERDSRVWVPKRNPAMGWTVNTAKPGGLACLIGIPLLILAFICAVIRLVR